MTINIERPSWQADAACRGMPVSLFYPERGKHALAARAACASCPVSAECFEAGINENHGIWAGTNLKERRLTERRERTKRRNAAVCGTTGGYSAHADRGEPSCRACRWAINEYQRVKRADDQWRASNAELGDTA